MLLFGPYCLFGTCKHHPKVGNSHIIKGEDLCNIVVCSSETNAGSFTHQTKELGVDFEFDGTSLWVMVQYKQCMGRDNVIQNGWHSQT